MFVLILLVVLSALALTLTTKVRTHHSRNQYMLDYQASIYACESAIKYSISLLQETKDPNFVIREKVPDFSELFTYSEKEYKQLLQDWADEITEEQKLQYAKVGKDYGRGTTDINDTNDINDINELDIFANISQSLDYNDANLLQVPGPYGPKWPLIREAVSFNIGDVLVNIEIHDENAKYPMGWLMLNDKAVKQQISNGFDIMCAWMDVNNLVIKNIKDDVQELAAIKPYKLEYKDIKVPEKQPLPTPTRRRPTSRVRRTTSNVRTRTVIVKIPGTRHLTDLSKLYHSSLVDTELLARPIIETENRTESAIKYISLFGANKINVNSAPRHVLEAAFAFAGISNAKNMAMTVIEQRKIKPFKDLNVLREKLYGFSDSLDKCRQYIVTKSNFYTIRITATKGYAKRSVIVAVKKEAGKLTKIATLSG